MNYINKIALGYWSIMSTIFAALTTFLITSGVIMAVIVFAGIEAKAAFTNLYLIFLACSMVPNILLPVIAILLAYSVLNTKRNINNGQIDNKHIVIQTISITALLILEIVAFYTFGIAIDIVLAVAFITWILYNLYYIKNHKAEDIAIEASLIPPMLGGIFGIIFALCLYIPMM